MNNYTDQINTLITAELTGRVVRTEGLTAAVAGLPAPVGAEVEIQRDSGSPIRAQVIGFREASTIVYPFNDIAGVRHGSRVRLSHTSRTVAVGDGLLGRVIDGHGQPLDGRPAPGLRKRLPLVGRPLVSFQRPRIDTPLATGVRAIDGMLTCGRGQRIGIFAGSGVGKSFLLGMMARYTSADVNVIALVGERGREVNEFIERDLGSEGRQRSVVVVATNDEPALMRVQAAMTATAIAEFFRDSGKNVLLVMDSLTRLAMAQREIGLAAGEPPTTRGYPPSIYTLLPKIVERAGRTKSGSITAFYSVLVEGDDPSEPVADTVRSLLDGHIVLSRKLAAQNHYPAIDVLESISRVMPQVADDAQKSAAHTIRELMAAYRNHEDLISIGAYQSGSNPVVDRAIVLKKATDAFLKQAVEEHTDLGTTQRRLIELSGRCPIVNHSSITTPATA